MATRRRSVRLTKGFEDGVLPIGRDADATRKPIKGSGEAAVSGETWVLAHLWVWE